MPIAISKKNKVANIKEVQAELDSAKYSQLGDIAKSHGVTVKTQGVKKAVIIENIISALKSKVEIVETVVEAVVETVTETIEEVVEELTAPIVEEEIEVIPNEDDNDEYEVITDNSEEINKLKVAISKVSMLLKRATGAKRTLLVNSITKYKKVIDSLS